ncbi:MAG: hypothetical protein JO066_13615 [Verrucomicrobia bacterium]|nr:hypothetical protein [Verrucomicrobiota bacterium]
MKGKARGGDYTVVVDPRVINNPEEGASPHLAEHHREWGRRPKLLRVAFVFYCEGVTTVVVVEVEAGGDTGAVSVVVRLTVVVVVVGGGVETTSSLVHAPKQAAAAAIRSKRSNVFICANKLRNRGSHWI